MARLHDRWDASSSGACGLAPTILSFRGFFVLQAMVSAPKMTAIALGGNSRSRLVGSREAEVAIVPVWAPEALPGAIARAAILAKRKGAMPWAWCWWPGIPGKVTT